MAQNRLTGPSRREFLQGVAAGAAAIAAPSLTGCSLLERSPATSPPTFRNSLCISPFSEEVINQGISFQANGEIAGSLAELQQLYMSQGGGEIFARVGTRLSGHPQRGFPLALRYAQLAKQLNIPLNPELLLCAYYGDESGQPEPDFSDYPDIRLAKPWSKVSINEICDALRRYGQIKSRILLDTGVTVNVWDIGNEVDCGMAGVALPPMNPRIGRGQWQYTAPDGVDPEIGKMSTPRFFAMDPATQADWGKQHLWNYVGKMLVAVADGIRENDPNARFATHLGGLAVQRAEVLIGFYEAIQAEGFAVDDLGTSFYPTAYPYFMTEQELAVTRLDAYKRTALLARQRFGKPLYIAEYAYAAAPIIFGGKSWANPVPGYPISEVGQTRFLRDLMNWGLETQTLSGIRPWAPDYVASGWQGMALFSHPVEGVAHARYGLGVMSKFTHR